MELEKSDIMCASHKKFLDHCSKNDSTKLELSKKIFWGVIHEESHTSELKIGLNVIDLESDARSPFMYTFTENKDVFQLLNNSDTDPIPTNRATHYICRVELPVSDEDFFCEIRDSYWYTNKIIIREKLILKSASTIEFLIDAGADPNTYGSVMRWACEVGNLEIVKLMITKGVDVSNGYYLTWAAGYGNTSVVKFLIENGADIHCDKDWALRWAVVNNHYETVVCLVEKGADVVAKDN